MFKFVYIEGQPMRIHLKQTLEHSISKFLN